MQGGMESRRLKNVQSNIELLGANEHGVLLNMVRVAGVPYDHNVNGYFFDLSALDDAVLDDVEEYVRYSLENNTRLRQHDRCMHDQMQLLRRVPPHVSEPAKPKKYVQREVVRADGAFNNRGAKLAFFKRASDSQPRRRNADAAEERDPPVFLRPP